SVTVNDVELDFTPDGSPCVGYSYQSLDPFRGVETFSTVIECPFRVFRLFVTSTDAGNRVADLDFAVSPSGASFAFALAFPDKVTLQIMSGVNYSANGFGSSVNFSGAEFIHVVWANNSAFALPLNLSLKFSADVATSR